MIQGEGHGNDQLPFQAGKLYLVLMQDVLLLDSLRGSWDSSDVSLYYNYLLANSTSAAANGLTAPLQHQRQQLDPAYKSVPPASISVA